MSREKVDKVADKNLDSRLDIMEAREVLLKADSDSLSVDKRMLAWGYQPSINDMQIYLKAEGKFDEKTDDSQKLDSKRKMWGFPFRLSY